MTGIDGRVSGLNNDVFQALQNIKKTNSGALSETDAKTLQTAINKDGKIDSAEQDLLTELTQSSLRSINIQSADSPAQSVVFATTSGKARSVLQETQTSTAQLKKLASEGEKGIQELTKIYQRSPADAERVVAVLAKEGLAAWDKSSVTNGYGPLTQMISSAYAGINKMSGQDNTDGRWMLHKAIKQIDTVKNDAIPDFLYNWIRPGGRL
jgi:t-SNARE complex subunit (syntaxin)